MATKDNLKEAFAGESQANRRYLAFAKKADADGFPHIAKLFRAAAAAETVHAHAHLRAMRGIDTTEKNLIKAVEGESHEFKSMYPQFLEEAQKENDKSAEISFRFALAVEEIHHQLYKEALKSVQAGKDLPKKKIYVCGVCGNTVYDEAPEKCPVCNAPKSKFKEID
ncbi:MAG: rubrerythrin family protein [Pseudomonadota bacterium]